MLARLCARRGRDVAGVELDDHGRQGGAPSVRRRGLGVFHRCFFLSDSSVSINMLSKIARYNLHGTLVSTMQSARIYNLWTITTLPFDIQVRFLRPNYLKRST
jgi:hypothetical protein